MDEYKQMIQEGNVIEKEEEEFQKRLEANNPSLQPDSPIPYQDLQRLVFRQGKTIPEVQDIVGDSNKLLQRLLTMQKYCLLTLDVKKENEEDDNFVVFADQKHPQLKLETFPRLMGPKSKNLRANCTNCEVILSVGNSHGKTIKYCTNCPTVVCKKVSARHIHNAECDKKPIVANNEDGGASKSDDNDSSWDDENQKER